MGLLGQTEHPDVRAAIEAGLGKIAASDKAAGILALTDEAADLYRTWGAQFLAVGIDVVMLAQAARALMASWEAKR
jgi:4-hydroxy-2-oxoheptanedioate aldolase